MILKKTIQNLVRQSEKLEDPTPMLRMIGLVAFAFGSDFRGRNHHYLEHIDEVTGFTLKIFQGHPTDVVEHVSVGSVGHDLFEDKFEMFGGKSNLERLIREQFGESILITIQLLTNPDFPEGITLEERHTIYREHVRTQVLSTNLSAGIKLADFTSNTNSIKRLAGVDEVRRLRLAKKYHPLFPDFIEVAKSFDKGDFVKILEENRRGAELVLFKY
jgi:hypothetical protein